MATTLVPPSPATLNFLSGLSAGAGINMLTSVATAPEIGSVQVIADSGLWVVTAALFTVMATLSTDTRARLERDLAGLTEAEIIDGRAESRDSQRTRMRTLASAAVLATALAALFVPNLVDWHGARCLVVDCPQAEPSPGRGNPPK